MRVQFLRNCQLEVCERFDELNDIADMTTDFIKEGERMEFDIIDHPEKIIDGKLVPIERLVNVQFGDGSMAFSVDRSWFKEIN